MDRERETERERDYLKYVIKGIRDDTAHLLIRGRWTLHGEALATAGLTVGEDGRVETF